MKVYLLNPELIQPGITAHQRACYDQIKVCAGLDRQRRHEQTTRIEEADLILAAIQGNGFGSHFHLLRASALYRTYKHKLVAYCHDDLVYPAVLGLYPSVTPYWAREGWSCGAHYVSSHIHRHRFDPALPASQREFLFAFVGSSRTHPLRESLLELSHPRSFISDSTPKSSPAYWWQDEQTRHTLFARFEQVLNRTRFALCPRGISASSIRLFEAMEAGCVPVIIADRLVLPRGPDWESCCVRIPEQEITSIPAVLEAMEARFESMGKAARIVWERHFSPAATFDSLVEWGIHLIQNMTPRRRKRLEAQVLLGEYVLPGNVRRRCREFFWTAANRLPKRGTNA